MKKVALVFVLAVFAPSLVLAWLAVRSARDQQIVVTRQQTLLYQGAADALAKDVRSFMGDRQREFAQIVEDLRRNFSSADLASRFDALCVRTCPSADVGFAVNTEGDVLSPSLFDRAQAREFRLNNDRFLGNRESVAVYWNSPKEALAIGKSEPQAPSGVGLKYRLNKNDLSVSTNVVVVKEMSASKVFPEETAFKELIGDSFEGTIARFLQNKLTVMLWYRSPGEPELIYGAQLNLSNIVARLKPLIRLRISEHTRSARPRCAQREARTFLGCRCDDHCHRRGQHIDRCRRETSTRPGTAQDGFREQRVARTENASHEHPHVFRTAQRRKNNQ